MRRPELIARQSACPSGLLGRLIGFVMAKETAAVNEAAIERLRLEPSDRVLEVGFGHGVTIARAAAAVSGGFVAGIDPSGEMLRMASRRNRRAIHAGRVELRQAVAEAIPYPDQFFDKVLAVHTAYFWASLDRPFREMARVLRAGGLLVLVHRTDGAAASTFPASIYRFRSMVEVDAGLNQAGLAVEECEQRVLGGATISFHTARRRDAG